MALTPDDMHDIAELARKNCLARVEAQIEILAPGGVSYWDSPLVKDEDFVLFYMGLRDYSDPQWGEHLDLTLFLPTLAPATWKRWTDHYHRAVSKAVVGVGR